MEHNTANFTLRFVVKNLAQMERAINEINKNLGKMADSAEKSNNRSEQATDRATDSIAKMQKALDKTIVKWTKVGIVVGLVSSMIRKAFTKADEYIGLKAISQSADVATTKIERLGKALKESYGGSFGDAAAAYTSLSDILFGARTGKGISDQVAIASSRYGIALNAGNMSEEQLMTNIAVAMKNANATYGMAAVREIADAFGIDQAMMLHLTERGANWDRNLPESSLAQMKAEAEQAKVLQQRWDTITDKLINVVFPKLIPLIDMLITWVSRVLDPVGSNKNLSNILNRDRQIAEYNKTASGDDITYLDRITHPTASFEELKQISQDRFTKKYNIQPFPHSLDYMQEYLDYYNANLQAMGIENAISGLETATGQRATLENGQLVLTINDNAGVLKDTQLILTSAQNSTLVK